MFNICKLVGGKPLQAKHAILKNHDKDHGCPNSSDYKLRT